MSAFMKLWRRKLWKQDMSGSAQVTEFELSMLENYKWNIW
jgi:hypothetical protein